MSRQMLAPRAVAHGEQDLADRIGPAGFADNQEESRSMPSPPSCEYRPVVRSSARKVFTDLFDLLVMGEALPMP